MFKVTIFAEITNQLSNFEAFIYFIYTRIDLKSIRKRLQGQAVIKDKKFNPTQFEGKGFFSVLRARDTF